jgi:hypothetical protein
MVKDSEPEHAAKSEMEGEQMSLDQSKVGRVVAEQMEAIENDYGEDCEIGDVCTIVEVVGPHGSHVRVRSSDMRPHSGLGLIRMAEQAMLGNLGGN